METNSTSRVVPHFRGRVITPGDADYETARKVHNGMVDKCPELIVKCADAADVVKAVQFAREHNLLVAVRGGGHNGAGLGVCDQGLVIDLSGMRDVSVDPQVRTIRAQGGCLLGDLDKAGHPHGLAVPTGINATTGIGGLCLGGGLGHLTRFAGLTIDNLLEAEVVLADGNIVKASPNENEDLFWALRGGGGNFGVVTSFLFRAHQVHTVFGGPMFWHMDDAKDLMAWYQDFIKQAPDSVNGFFAFHKIPPAPMFPEQYHLQTMCGIVWCCVDEEEATAVFDKVRAFRKPLIDAAGPLPVPALQTMFDDLFAPGLYWYWKGDFVKHLSSEVMDVHIRHAHKIPNFFSGMHLYPINGAASRVRNEDTAWNYRDATWSMVIVGISPDPSEKGLVTTFARDYWQELHPHGAGGAYVNFMMDEGADRVKATYGSNYEKLVRIKTKYDPDNLFRVNQNIKPS